MSIVWQTCKTLKSSESLVHFGEMALDNLSGSVPVSSVLDVLIVYLVHIFNVCLCCSCSFFGSFSRSHHNFFVPMGTRPLWSGRHFLLTQISNQWNQFLSRSLLSVNPAVFCLLRICLFLSNSSSCKHAPLPLILLLVPLKNVSLPSTTQNATAPLLTQLYRPCYVYHFTMHDSLSTSGLVLTTAMQEFKPKADVMLMELKCDGMLIRLLEKLLQSTRCKSCARCYNVIKNRTGW